MNLHPTRGIGTSPRANHVAVRLADEGVPICAIARATQRRSEDICNAVKDAIADGSITTMPAMDWPAGSRREGRFPMLKPISMDEVEPVAIALRLAFRLPPAACRVLAVIVLRGEAQRTTLHAVACGENSEADPKIVDIYVNTIRKKLSVYGIAIETVWGRGYAVTKINQRAILERIQAANPTTERAAKAAAVA